MPFTFKQFVHHILLCNLSNAHPFNSNFMDILMIIMLGCVMRVLTHWFANVMTLLTQVKCSAGCVMRVLTRINFIRTNIMTIDVEESGTCDGRI